MCGVLRRGSAILVAGTAQRVISRGFGMETGYGGRWHGNGHFDAISPTHKFDLSMFRWFLHVLNVFMVNAESCVFGCAHVQMGTHDRS